MNVLIYEGVETLWYRMPLQVITIVGTYANSPEDFRDTCADLRAGTVPAPKIILHP